MKSSEHEPLQGEVNPNHPMTQFARDQWHKIAALLMQELGKDQIEITMPMINKLNESNSAIVIQEKQQRLFIRIVSMEEGERLAREEGGMPA